MPILKIKEISESFTIMEKDLMPLIDLKRLPAFYISSENNTYESAL